MTTEKRKAMWQALNYASHLNELTERFQLHTSEVFGGDGRKFDFYERTTSSPLVASFTLVMSPGNAGWFVLGRKMVEPEFRRQGIGIAIHRFCLQILSQAGADLLTCTVRGDNVAQLHLLAKVGGWRIASNHRGKLLFVYEFPPQGYTLLEKSEQVFHAMDTKPKLQSSEERRQPKDELQTNKTT